MSGVATAPFGDNDHAADVALQPDGKIVAAGSTLPDADFAVARFAANGSLDGAFGTNGQVRTDFGGADHPFGMVLTPTGEIVVAGGSFYLPGAPSSVVFAVARYRSDGQLDASFGSDGLVVTDFGSWPSLAYDVARQPDGKIVVVGSVTPQSGDTALVRYDANGNLDPTFGTGGRVVTDRNYTFYGSDNDNAQAVAIQADGKILIAGYGGIARYNTDGTWDQAFSPFLSSFDAYDLAVQPDGKIVAVGNNSADDIAIVRYLSNGAVDPEFGWVTTDLGGQEGAGALVVKGGVITVAGFRQDASYHNDFLLVRYTSTGALDAGFGNGGSVVLDFGGDEGFTGLALQSDGKLVAAGGTRIGMPGSDFVVARFIGKAGPPRF